MNTLSVGTNYAKKNNTPSFGMRIRNDAQYHQFRSFLNKFSPCETDAFVKLIEEEPVGGDKDAVELIFYPMQNRNGTPYIWYSFRKNWQGNPIMPHYMARIDNHENMLNEIISDANRFDSGADDRIIQNREQKCKENADMLHTIEQAIITAAIISALDD